MYVRKKGVEIPVWRIYNLREHADLTKELKTPGLLNHATPDLEQEWLRFLSVLQYLWDE